MNYDDEGIYMLLIAIYKLYVSDFKAYLRALTTTQSEAVIEEIETEMSNICDFFRYSPIAGLLDGSEAIAEHFEKQWETVKSGGVVEIKRKGRIKNYDKYGIQLGR